MIFARGALAAARFLHAKPAGVYSMRDVIGARLG
jgi:dihydrodipicolinate reductase